MLLLGAGCIPGEGPLMSPGEDCLECHGAGEGPGWTAAGTWEGEGHSVHIRDANGKSFTLRTNRAGNFYTAEPITYPLRVDVDGEEMENDVPKVDATACIADDGDQHCCTGARCGCNDCHGRGHD